MFKGIEIPLQVKNNTIKPQMLYVTTPLEVLLSLCKKLTSKDTRGGMNICISGI